MKYYISIREKNQSLKYSLEILITGLIFSCAKKEASIFPPRAAKIEAMIKKKSWRYHLIGETH